MGLGAESPCRVAVSVIDIFRMEDDRIAEFWGEFDLYNLAQQTARSPSSWVSH